MMTMNRFVVLSVVAASLIAQAAFGSSDRQFTSNGYLIDGSPVQITVIGNDADQKQAETAASSAMAKIAQLDGQLFSQGGIQSQLDSLAKGQPLTLSPDAFSMLERAIMLSAQSSGWFDVAAPSAQSSFSKRDWRKISLKKDELTISFKSDGMQLDLRRIAKGFLVDLAMAEIMRSGFSNAMVEIDAVSRNIGHDIYTPWNVQIGFGQGESSQYAHRAISYKLKDVAAATVTPSGLGRDLIDGRGKQKVPEEMRSITILANDATTATAFGLAVYAIGPKHAMQYVEQTPAIKGIMVDGSGQIIASAGLVNQNPALTNRWPASQGTADGGPNDVRQKQREEEGDL